MISNNVIRIKCADKKGLIAAITGVLYSNDHNILVMREFVDASSDTFFTRLEIDGDLKESLKDELKKVLPEDA